MKRALGAAAVAIMLAAAPGGTVLAQDSENEDGNSPQALAREGAERLMRALDGLLQMIPQYGAPRIEENGDIVIPRLNPPEEDQGEEPPAEDDGGFSQREI
jgi:hypothetical protein